MQLKNNVKVIWRHVKSILKSPYYRARFYYTHFYETIEVDESIALFESYNCSNFSGNVYYLLLKVNEQPDLAHLQKYISCKTRKEQKKITAFLNQKGIDNFEVIRAHKRKYCRILCSAKYLFNNATFPSYYSKREGQVYFNTWHGTPLKTLGRSILSAPNEIGNTQRNFIIADYLLYSNDFTFQHMKEDYMLDNFYKGQYVLGGYPRNAVFYDQDHRRRVRNEQNIQDKEVICYMPTWRGTLDEMSVEDQILMLKDYLLKIDQTLSQDKVMYVKFHNFVSKDIRFTDYKHIYPFPKQYETYEFLAACDCLITDYSSVMFDYANLNKKIILFAYDKAAYLAERGMYLNIEDMPFPIATSVEDLCEELKDLHTFPNYQDFLQTYCPHDSEDYAQKIVDLVFHHKTEGVHLIAGKDFANEKKNVLIFAGSLAKNGLTTSLRGLIDHIDTSRYNYTVIFYRNAVKQNNYVIANFPKNVSYISIQGKKNSSIREVFSQFLFFRLNRESKRIQKDLKAVYCRELKRIFGGRLHFDYAIHFTGYEKQIANIYHELDDCKKIIYVHNDMRKEIDTKSNFHIPSIFRAYKEYDLIVGVRESIASEIIELLPELNPDKIKTVHNVNNIQHILSHAQKPLAFDMDTDSTHTLKEIQSFLDDESLYKYINVARFSPEKGIFRLIKAFEAFHKEHPQSVLFVIGGNGIQYQEIRDYVDNNKLRYVVVIRSLSNPFPILQKSDVFIMSSVYEGLPMSIMEALILGKQVVCTDITGPREFLRQGYGYLVSDSQEGVYQGFVDSFQTKLELKPFDAEEFNMQALQEFYNIL